MAREIPQFAELTGGYDAVNLLCACGHEYLHQGKVVLQDRAEDDPGTRTTLDVQGMPLVETINDPEFVGRRNDLQIEFTCEQCEKTNTLVIQQHKGYTLIFWALQRAPVTSRIDS